MKKYLLFVFAAAAIASACSREEFDSPVNGQLPAGETIVLGIEQAEQGKVQFNDDLQTVWTTGDKVSIFNKINGAAEYTFTGETGDRHGVFSKTADATKNTSRSYVVTVYPASSSHAWSSANNMTISKAVANNQTYVPGSIGVGSQALYSVTNSIDGVITLKYTASAICFKLSGTETVKSINFKGNNNETLCANMTLKPSTGEISANTTNASKSITLDCGEGVALNMEEATPFYISVLPVQLSKGFTATITCESGTVYELATAKSITLTRGHILPMAERTIAKPKVEMEDADMDDVHVLSDDLTVKINVSAPSTIESLIVRIKSDILTNEELQAIGLASEMNLAEPADEMMAASLMMLGFPVGEDVVGQSALSFDISQFMPLLIMVCDGYGSLNESRHDFEIEVTDAEGYVTSRTLKLLHQPKPSDVAAINSIDLWHNTAVIDLFTDVESVQYRIHGSEDLLDATINGNQAIIEPEWTANESEKTGESWIPVTSTGIWAGKAYDIIVTDGKGSKTQMFLTAGDGDTLPYGNMESWSQYDGYSEKGTSAGVWYPNPSKGNAFWSNGNNSTTKDLCTKGTENGNSYALLQSSVVNVIILKIFTAGNMFAGNFLMSGTKGYAKFGVKYDFSARPSALKVKHISNVGKIDNIGNKSGVTTSDPDPQTIFVAIVDWNAQHAVCSGVGVKDSEINPFDPETMASTSEGAVIAYGKTTITESNTGWEEISIPIVYRDRDTKPSGEYTLVISASASAYGDYLCGCSKNSLKVDDFCWEY